MLKTLQFVSAGVGLALAVGAGAQCDPPVVAEFDADDQGSFGQAVALYGDWAVIGAPNAADYTGAVYVFRRAGDGWTQPVVLAADDGAPGDVFGVSVSTDGQTAVIGAHGHDAGGAAYVFVRAGDVWTQQAMLTAGGPTDGFGRSVSVDGDTVVVGANADNEKGGDAGAAYVFTRSGDVWSLEAKLTAGDAKPEGTLGLSVCVLGDVVLAGAVGQDKQRGAAYVFRRAGDEWSQEAKLVAMDAAIADRLGWSVRLGIDTAIVGAPFDDDLGYSAGSAYVFSRAGGVWEQEAKFLANDGATGDSFGTAIALSGNVAAVGSPWDNDGVAGAGSAYVFVRDGDVWTQQAKLVSANPVEYSGLGAAASCWGIRLLVGSSLDGFDGEGAGAFEFDLSCLVRCPADLDGNGLLDLFDFLSFTNLFNAGDPGADWDANGVFDLFDFLGFVNAFNDGCE